MRIDPTTGAAVPSPERPAVPVAKAVAAVVLAAGVACAITVVFLAMRRVMDIGGACASGGPFVPVQPCPEGVPGLLVGGIILGLAMAFAYAWVTLSAGIPGFAWLMWPALFGALGWNFIDYGVSPPDGGDPVWGWLVCGVVFFLMALLPLGLGVLAFRRPEATRLRTAAGLPPARRDAPATADGAGADPPAGAEAASVVDALERLAALHRGGAISDAEYEAAKRQILSGGLA
jgi:hypothetical protein